MQLFSEAILLFCAYTVKLLLWDAALTGRFLTLLSENFMIYTPAESAEVIILLSTFDKKVNSSSSIKLNCVTYGRLSAPSIEWELVTNGRTSTIRNSTSNRVIIPIMHKSLAAY